MPNKRKKRKQHIQRKYKGIRPKKEFKELFNKIKHHTVVCKILYMAKLFYRGIQIITTLFAFTCILFFLYGKFTENNISDNDLIMEQIEREAGNGKVTSIVVSDIHGFGYNSIIASIADEKFHGYDVNNRLVIMDYINDSFLRTMYDLFKFGSAYKTTFSYSLYDNAGGELYPKVINVMDICGDTCKEIIVKYGLHKQETTMTNINLFAIFQYSYDKDRYELKGTYPKIKKYDLVTESDIGNTHHITRESEDVITDFHIFYDENPPSAVSCHDNYKNNFNLTPYIDSTEMQFWVHGKNIYGDMLVLVDVDRSQSRALINAYMPLTNQDELEWRVMYSEYMDTSKDDCKIEALEKLETDLNESFEMIQEIGR
jgi:hypothetical protein